MTSHVVDLADDNILQKSSVTTYPVDLTCDSPPKSPFRNKVRLRILCRMHWLCTFPCHSCCNGCRQSRVTIVCVLLYKQSSVTQVSSVAISRALILHAHAWTAVENLR